MAKLSEKLRFMVEIYPENRNFSAVLLAFATDASVAAHPSPETFIIIIQAVALILKKCNKTVGLLKFYTNRYFLRSFLTINAFVTAQTNKIKT